MGSHGVTLILLLMHFEAPVCFLWCRAGELWRTKYEKFMGSYPVQHSAVICAQKVPEMLLARGCGDCLLFAFSISHCWTQHAELDRSSYDNASWKGPQRSSH